MRGLWLLRPGLLLPRVLAPLLSHQPWAALVSLPRPPPVFFVQPLIFPCFGVFVADDPDGFARTFAGSRVRARALATNRQATSMPDPAITIDRLQTLEVALRFTAQIAFDRDLVARDRMNNFVQLLRGKIFRAQIRIDIGLIENALRDRRPDPVNIGERRFDAFIRRNFNSK